MLWVWFLSRGYWTKSPPINARCLSCTSPPKDRCHPRLVGGALDDFNYLPIVIQQSLDNGIGIVYHVSTAISREYEVLQSKCLSWWQSIGSELYVQLKHLTPQTRSNQYWVMIWPWAGNIGIYLIECSMFAGGPCNVCCMGYEHSWLSGSWLKYPNKIPTCRCCLDIMSSEEIK